MSEKNLGPTRGLTDYDRLRRLDDVVWRHTVREMRGTGDALDENEPLRSYDAWRDNFVIEQDAQAARRDMERIDDERGQYTRDIKY